MKKVKGTTLLKIAFCVLLIVALVMTGLGFRFGKNRLRAELADVRNADYLERLVRDFDGNADLLDGFSVSKEAFYQTFVQNAAAYYGQKLRVNAQNRTNRDITVVGLRARNEDEDAYGIYLSRTPLTAVTIPAGTTEPKSVWFYVMDDRDNEDVLSILRSEYALELLYVDAATGVTRLADATPEQLRAERIRFSGTDAWKYQTEPPLGDTLVRR